MLLLSLTLELSIFTEMSGNGIMHTRTSEKSGLSEDYADQRPSSLDVPYDFHAAYPKLFADVARGGQCC